MEFSWLLIDVGNYTELFLMIMFTALNLFMVVSDYFKRKNIIAGLKREMQRRNSQQAMIKLLSHFIGIQKDLKKKLIFRVSLLLGAHLILYFVFLYGYYRFGAIILALLIYGIVIGSVQYIFSREVK